MLITLSLAALVCAATQPPAPPVPAPPAMPPVETARLEAIVKSLPPARAGKGDAEHLDGLIRTQTLLLEQVRALGFEPNTSPVNWSIRGKPETDREWINIFFEIPGREQPKDILLIGAHFDAVPGSPGADDNASGVAGLLEIARVLKDQPLRRTVRFALYNLEEVGLIGSTQHVAEWTATIERHGENLLAMLSLEMIGYYRDEPGSQRNPFAQIRTLAVPDRGEFIGIAALLSSRPWVRVLEREMKRAEPEQKVFVFDYLPLPAPDILRSDNGPWMLRNLPAAMVTDTANFRNPNYHQSSDTPGTLDWPRFTRTVSALAGAIRAMAGPVGQPDPEPADLSTIPSLLPPTPTRTPPGEPDQPMKRE